MANIQTTITGAIKITRPIQWVKNVSVFAALVFSGNLYREPLFINVFWTFWVFCFAASATYILNDIFDAPKDRLHPIKKFRPIASNSLPIPIAILECIFLAFLSLVIANAISSLLFLLIIFYLVLQVAYSSFLKRLAIIDIIIIATGFVIRVYAGAFAIDAHLSVWFLLCVVSTALFLASGKRRAELGIMGKDGNTRTSLTHYPKELLNSYVTMFASSAWLSWALFTFFESPAVPKNLWLFLAEFSKTTTISKLLMITIPFAIFAIMRYQGLIFEGRSESPEKVLLTDISLIASVMIWTILVISILYGGIQFHFNP
ncbi:decaprenyl-phosphate phosphoribosyltransferase [soil metagenome]